MKLIEERERAGAILSHQLGTVYAHVMREQLYTQDGYEDFWSWVEKGLKRSRSYVHKLLAMVTAFPNEKEVAKIGATSARVIARVTDETFRRTLIRAAKKGVSAEALEARIQRLKQRQKESAPQKKRGPGAKYVEIDALVRTRRVLEIDKPVPLVDGLTVELRRTADNRFTLRFAREN